MAFNIMDMITDQLTPDNVGVLAKFLGEDSSLVTKAISAAAPMLLGGILDSSAKPAGRDLFNKSIDQADTSLLGNLAGVLTGSSGNSMISTGISLLTNLFGDNKLGALIKGISAFSGMSSGSSKSLLGAAAPMLMSMLSKKKQDDGLDNNGLFDMLSGQKKNIASAITPEMKTTFSGLGLLDGIVDQAADSVKTTAQNISDASQQAATESKSFFSKLLPYLIIALIALLVYQYFMKPRPESIGTSSEQTMMQALTVNNTNLGESLVGVLDDTRQVLSTVTDDASANAALSSMMDINQRLDDINRLAPQLSPEGQRMLAQLASKTSSSLDSLMDQVFSIPGAGDVLGNSINTMRQHLAKLANQ